MYKAAAVPQDAIHARTRKTQRHGLKSARGGAPLRGFPLRLGLGQQHARYFNSHSNFMYSYHYETYQESSMRMRTFGEVRRACVRCAQFQLHTTRILSLQVGTGAEPQSGFCYLSLPHFEGRTSHGRQASGARQLWQGRVRNVRGPPCCPSTYRVAALYTRVAETEPMSARLLCSSQMSVHSCRIASLW